MKKTVFIFINCLDVGGAERVASLLLHYWNDCYNIKLVVLENSFKYEIPSNIEIILLKGLFSQNKSLNFLSLPFLALKYKRLCKRHEVFASISLLKRPNYISALSRVFGNNTKVIISERSYFSLLIQHVPFFKRTLSLFLTKRLYPHADLIVTNSQLIETDLKNTLHIKAHFEVIHNPVDIDDINNKSKEAIEWVTSDSFYFIHAGGFRKEKNQGALIDAFAGIQHENVKLILLGEGLLKEQLQRRVLDLGLNERVVFPPFDTNPFKYFVKCGCYVLPSKFEGFPNSILEAMACGLPVISFDCLSGPREILAPATPVQTCTQEIEFAEYGILVPVNDTAALTKSMERVAVDRQLQLHYRQKSLERIKNFEVSKQLKKFSAIVESA